MRVLPHTLRLLNQRRVLERLREAGAASRAELAAATGMSRPTAGKIIDDLLAARVLEEEPPEAGGGPGRPGRRVRLEGRTPRFLLVQLGVHRTDVAAVPVAGAPEEPWAHGFATPRSPAAFGRLVAEAARRLGLRRPWAFAVSVPGVLDERTGVSRYSPNLHWTEGEDLPGLLRGALGAPGCGVQEIRALALGHLEAAGEAGGFLLVDAGEGLGGAAAVRGALVDGALPFSGELGHTPVPGGERPCGCGGRGCLETVMARPGLLASFAAAGRPGRAPTWEALHAQLQGRPPPRWLDEAVAACARTVAGALNTLGLDRVVLTGLFAALPAACLDRFRAELARGSLAARFGQVAATVAPRRRARGLLRRIFDRLLLETDDWRAPCALPSDAA